MSRFDGKVAIVTGGANGIGAATVRRLVSEGAQVIIADTATPANGGGRISFLQADVTNAADAATVVAASVQKWGRLDILVNNAGVGAFGETADIDEAQ